eukprot:COSAG06_NODE_1083_length_10780_cov_2.547608_11_plen_63_part_01
MVGLRKGYSTKLPLIRRWRCGARVVRLPGVAPFAARAGSRPREPVVFRAEPSFAGTFFGGMIA